jgi:hypothetical protein
MLDLFFAAAVKVLVAGLVLGAGLPALFALGVRFTALGAGDDAGVAATGGGGTAAAVRGHAGYRLLGLACFVVVALAVALGITVVVASGFGKMLDFGGGLPTLVDK